MRDTLIKLQKVDRRWVYLAVALACMVPFIAQLMHKPITLNVHASPETQKVYNEIESLPRDGSKVVLIDSGWDQGSKGENMGQMEAVVEHLLRNNIPFVAVDIGGSDKGPIFINKVVEKYTKDEVDEHGKVIHKARYPNKVYGKDWVNLGWLMVGGWQTISLVAKDMHQAKPTDYFGNKTDDAQKLPLMQKVKSIEDVAMVFCVTYSPAEDWIPFVHGVYGTPIAFGCAGIESTTKYRYIPSKQLTGLLVSVRGGAEYDTLLHPDNKADRTNYGSELIVPLAFGHLVIILMIILGNVGYFAERKRRSER